MHDNLDNAPVFDLCNASEKRFLLDLIQGQNPDYVSDHPLPEVEALLLAVERMWGGKDATRLMIPTGLLYYLAVYAAYAHRIHEDVAGWRSGAVHDVYRILQGLMESVALAIKDGSLVRHEDDGVYIDALRIPQWFYKEVMNGRP